MEKKQGKNKLSIRLTESAVFLRTCSGRRIITDSQPAMLRGLLVLDIAKPTRISSIELELKANTMTIRPEGFGARRVDVTEEHTVFHTSVVYFKVGQTAPRRPLSVGPGLVYDGFEAWDEYPHTASMPSSRQSPTRPNSRQGRRLSVDGYVINNSADQYHQYTNMPIPPYSPAPMISSPSSAEPSTESSAAPLPLNSPSHSRSRSALPILEDSSTMLPLSRGRQNGNAERAYSTSRSLLRSVTPLRSRDSSKETRSEPRRSRFSLASFSNALIDAVRPTLVADEDQSRGRTLAKGATANRDRVSQSPSRAPDHATSSERPIASKERTALDMISDFLRLDLHGEHKEYGSDWKEFKKGTYTYPISLAIPGHSPPTLYCEFGHVIWTLRAVVHRPGAFNTKLTAKQEVMVVACPIDDVTEDGENIIVERHWDNQLQYLLSVSGRSFYIGGTMPISLTFLPLAKVKIHKIVMCIEERVDYLTRRTRIAHSEPISRFVLLSIKGNGKGEDPILPLESDDVDAFKKSPLYKLVTPDDDPSEMMSSLMGPGPWTFHHDLQLPTSCNQMHFTNRNQWSNISISHILKWIIRVESASDLHVDPKTGRRKLFEIIVQTPVHILSCRCNPDWTALPNYSERLSNPHAVVSECPCDIGRSKWSLRRPATLDRATSQQSLDSSVSSAETGPLNFQTMRSLRQELPTLQEVTLQFERLVSGQETETGETPPAYEE